MNEQQELAKILGLSPTASWAEIYVEIGRLKERKNDSSYYPPIPIGGVTHF